MALTLSAALGLGLLVHPPRCAFHPDITARYFPPSLCVDVEMSERRVREAAIRVVAAASQFGDAQGEAAAEWVKEAMDSRSREVDCAALLGKQMALFEECLIEESALCKELDQALTLLEGQLEKGETGTLLEGQLDALVGLFGQSQLDRALARVRTAASKFGVEQGKIAKLWVKDVRRNRKNINPLTLLEQQTSLFGECLVEDDDEDGGSGRCEELNEALGALQRSLGIRGRVVSTGSLVESQRN